MEKKTAAKEKNVHSGHRQRVKENVRQNGFSQLEEHRLLELLLFYSIPQADTNGLAHKLLIEFGSIDEIFMQDCRSLEKVSGVGQNTAIMLAAMGEAFRRVSKAKHIKKPSYKNSSDYSELARDFLADEDVETVVLFCFDAGKRLKKTVTVSRGDVKSSVLDIRKVVQASMDSNAVFVVLAHNHPEGSCEPSASDIDSTRSLCVTLRKLGVLVADHIILGMDGSAFSMQSDDLLSKMFL